MSAQELNFALLPRLRSMVARRGRSVAAARPMRAGRALGRLEEGEGGVAGCVPSSRRLQGGQIWPNTRDVRGVFDA